MNQRIIKKKRISPTKDADPRWRRLSKEERKRLKANKRNPCLKTHRRTPNAQAFSLLKPLETETTRRENSDPWTDASSERTPRSQKRDPSSRLRLCKSNSKPSSNDSSTRRNAPRNSPNKEENNNNARTTQKQRPTAEEPTTAEQEDFLSSKRPAKKKIS